MRTEDVELIRAATTARRKAYAPYSRYRVGAAVRAADGRIFTGCNVENASYGLAICAERVAVTKAVSEGVREFTAVAIVVSGRLPASPCGACRQFLHEFAPELRVVLADESGRGRVTSLPRLLPGAFGPLGLAAARPGPRRTGRPRSRRTRAEGGRS